AMFGRRFRRVLLVAIGGLAAARALQRRRHLTPPDVSRHPTVDGGPGRRAQLAPTATSVAEVVDAVDVTGVVDLTDAVVRTEAAEVTDRSPRPQGRAADENAHTPTLLDELLTGPEPTPDRPPVVPE